MTKSTLDFKKVEALRKHMLLTTAYMAKALGVSRATYAGWVKGKPIRKANDENARNVLRGMFVVMKNHKWPTPEVAAATSEQRYNMLLEVMPKEE